MSDDNRPNPEALLRAIQSRERGENHGRLRVFIGMCPGVGKTYAMLKAAREAQERGIKVSVGVVETHGRKETRELVEGLRVLPRRVFEYKDTTLNEMDLDLALKEAPELILVDELAHSNAPQSRHRRRFQDVQELLLAGIDVYTTVNIQHVESRNDQIAQITGIHVRETVPDSFFELADQIQVIDISPQELLVRLKEGKVYRGERAERAANNFFKEESLTALRELALRFTAEMVDQDLTSQMTIKGINGPWNTNERLAVAVSHSPYSNRLIRATRRMAHNLEAPWTAIYVDTGVVLNPEDQAMLQKNLSLARELGADVVTFADAKLSRAIAHVCRDKNVTQIVLGRPDRRFFRDLLARGTLLDELVRTTSKLDVHVIRSERRPRYRGLRLAWPSIKAGFFPYYNTAWFLSAVTALCFFALPFVGYRALGSVFLLSLLGVASVTSPGPIAFAAVFSALAWDYFFIPPRFTFSITAADDYFMVFSFFVAALISGLLTSRIRRQEEVLQAREGRAQSLYQLSRNLTEARDAIQVSQVLSSTLNRHFSFQSLFLKASKKGPLENHAQNPLDEKEFAVAAWAFENKKPAGWSTSTLSGSRFLCLPMKGNSRLIGCLALLPLAKQKVLTVEQENFLNTVITQAALALERIDLAQEAEALKIYESSEKLQQTLLDSISHEMRTPLTVLMGTASVLNDPTQSKTAEQIQLMSQELVEASQRLDRVIENLLDMNRLNAGVVTLNREWYELQDLFQMTLKKVASNLKNHRIEQSVSLVPLVQLDYRLFEHALANLLVNAANYSPPRSLIRLSAGQTQNQVWIEVEDEGPGIPIALREKVFEKFYRIPGTPAGGTGLGLSIVRSIVEAHQGQVLLSEASLGGSSFKITLPKGQNP